MCTYFNFPYKLISKQNYLIWNSAFNFMNEFVLQILSLTQYSDLTRISMSHSNGVIWQSLMKENFEKGRGKTRRMLYVSGPVAKVGGRLGGAMLDLGRLQVPDFRRG